MPLSYPPGRHLPGQGEARHPFLALPARFGERRAKSACEAPLVVRIEKRADRDALVAAAHRDSSHAFLRILVQLKPDPGRVEAQFLHATARRDLADDQRLAADLDVLVGAGGAVV